MALKFLIHFVLVITSIFVTCSSNHLQFTSIKRSVSKSYPVKTIRVKDGDIIDCINIFKQPAFSHPALKNHTIQRNSTSSQGATLHDSLKFVPQVWHQYGSCPLGTIPIRRILNNRQSSSRKIIVTPNHSFSVVLTLGYSYSGAKSDIKVWNPYIESNDDYSTSSIMLITGPLKSFEKAQAGWAVNPIVYGDTKTRLFAYWTIDGSISTGCFDLTCPGFVQTSHQILLGGDIGVYYGSEITIQISKDRYTSNWWLKFNEIEVGYWPADIFPLLKHQAIIVQWGGEVYSHKVGTHPHTATAMGSGEFADPAFGTSGVITRMRVEENSNPLKQPEKLYVSSNEWDCYDAYLYKDNVPEPRFYFGGPGSRRNYRCP